VSTEPPALDDPEADLYLASLPAVLREWGRIGCVGFGGPPAHIALLRELCVSKRQWLDAAEFEDAIAVCNLLPGPASTELAIFCAWRVRGRLGALVGGAAFIVPGLILILALSALFLASAPPDWVRGAGAGAGSAVAAVAINAAWSLLAPSWKRASRSAPAGSASAGDAPAGNAGRDNTVAWRRARWVGYLIAGGVAAATTGPWLVLVLLGCGLGELAIRERARRQHGRGRDASEAGGTATGDPAPGGIRSDGQPRGLQAVVLAPLLGKLASAPVLGKTSLLTRAALLGKTATGAAVGTTVFGTIAWVAFKVGALSFGGGFVIIPLMQGDAVGRHWMTTGQFLNAVALGQITPGPVVQTVATVGYAAAGVPGGLLAAAVAFTPSFLFIFFGARYFHAIRSNTKPQAFLDGAGPAAIGAILGSAYLLARALSQPWQFAILAAAVLLLFVVRRGVVLTLLCAAAAGLIIAVSGGPLP
jgi:chromate transporter